MAALQEKQTHQRPQIAHTKQQKQQCTCKTTSISMNHLAFFYCNGHFQESNSMIKNQNNYLTLTQVADVNECPT
jgi:hypothetical protein